MSYSEIENSLDDGAPVELFEFRQGSEFWRYTTSPVDIVKTTQTFVAEAITRPAIKQTADMSKGGIQLKFPRTNLLAASYLSAAPEGVTTLTIWRKHLTDPLDEYIAYWKGRVLKASAGESEITLDCESVFTSLKRPGLRARYERGCRHSLYGSDCGLSLSSFQLSALVQGMDGLTLTIGDAASYADGNFTGGVISHLDGSHRMITYHVGTTIKINRAFRTTPLGTTVSMYPGCDKLKATCIAKFNNLDNFGGFPYIPYVNPFSGRSIV